MSNIYVFIITAILAAVVLSRFLRHRRAKALEKKMENSGCGFIAKGFLPKRFRDLKFSGLKYGLFFAKAENIITAEFKDFDISVFEYGRGRKHAFFTINFKEHTLPFFNLYPDGLAGKLDMSFSKQKQIQLDRNPEFSDKFLLYGENRDDLEQFFQDDLTGQLTAYPNFSFEGRKNTLLFFRKGATLNVESIDKAIPLAKEIAAMFLSCKTAKA